MAQIIETYEKCPQCKGAGVFTPSSGATGAVQITCNWPGCLGEGYVLREKTTYDPGLNDLLDKVNDILEKCNDILDKLNE